MSHNRRQRDAKGRLIVPDLSLPQRPVTINHGGRVVSLPARPASLVAQPLENLELLAPGLPLPMHPAYHTADAVAPAQSSSLPSRPVFPIATINQEHAGAGLPFFPAQQPQQLQTALPARPSTLSVFGNNGSSLPPRPEQQGLVKSAYGSGSNSNKNNNKSNKKGNGNAQKIGSQDNDEVPAAENCSTWWVNLPPGCTYQMLFDSMRGVGAISHASINPPSGTYVTASAKVDFFERASVDRLFRQRRQIRVGGVVPTITHNRKRVAALPNVYNPYSGESGRVSRVLCVVGDPRVVNVEGLTALFNEQRLRFEVEYVLEEVKGDGTHEVVFAFASYTMQAFRAFGVILARQRRNDLPDVALWACVSCVFGPDLCE